MRILTRHAVRRTKTRNTLAQGPLLAFEPLGVAFAGGKFGHEMRHQREHGGVLLSGFYADLSIGLVIDGDCDFSHVFTGDPQQVLQLAYLGRTSEA